MPRRSTLVVVTFVWASAIAAAFAWDEPASAVEARLDGYTDIRVGTEPLLNPSSGDAHPICFLSDKTVYAEELRDGRWVGRFWASNGRVKTAYEGWVCDAFSIELDRQPLVDGWKWESGKEEPRTERGARHFVVELSNSRRPVRLKVHTVLDGTPVLVRWLELTNTSSQPIALTALQPWTSQLDARVDADVQQPKTGPFTLGHFAKVGHKSEGWFEWLPVDFGKTTLGCDRGQCYDEPFFVVRNDATGEHLIGSLAWSANWRMEANYQREGTSPQRHRLRLGIGPWASDALRVVAAGETITTPAVHLGLVAGDLDATVQAMHAHVRHSVLPPCKPERAHLIQYAVPGDQGYLSAKVFDVSGCTEESILKNVEIAATIGAELFIMDAGWWETQGDWQTSPKRFPRGLQPVIDACHQKGLLFGLYAEAEKASAECQTAKKHPDWIEWYKPFTILDLSRPEVASSMESEIAGMVDRYQLDLFRLDFNTPTDARFEGQSATHEGIAENRFWRYYDNFQGVFDRIRAKYPELILQQAACGGGRNDLNVTGQFHEQYLTDGLRLPREARIYCGQTLALPPETLRIAHSADGADCIGWPDNLDTVLRLQFAASAPWICAGNVARSVAELHPDQLAKYRHYTELYKSFIRPLLPSCRVYHHAPVSSNGGVESSDWFALEYAAPDRTKGWAVVIRLKAGDEPTYRFQPRGLAPGQTYRVTWDNLDATAKVKGLSLMRDGIPLRLEAVGTSELLTFESE